MNAREAANVERWAAEDAAAKGRTHTPAWDAAWREHCANMEAEDAAAKEGPCALCRRARRQWEDLCDDCADVFQDLADALEDAQEARTARLEVVGQVAGQLELVEPAHDNGTYHATVAQSVQVLDALRRGGSFDGVDTMALLNVHADDQDAGHSLLNERERTALEAELERRA